MTVESFGEALAEKMKHYKFRSRDRSKEISDRDFQTACTYECTKDRINRTVQDIKERLLGHKPALSRDPSGSTFLRFEDRTQHNKAGFSKYNATNELERIS